MKALMVILDGVGDESIASLGLKTPLSYAAHPAMDALAAQGTTGKISVSNGDFHAESLKCILRLLGLPSADVPANRAYIELLAHTRDISEHEMVLRCNLVAIDAEGTLLGFNGQGLTAEEMSQAACVVDEHFSNIEFMHLSAYRNLLIMDKQPNWEALKVIKPPHESMGEQLQELLAPIQEYSMELAYFLEQARLKLSSYDRAGLRYFLYPWGVSVRSTAPSFSRLHHGLQGGVVCGAEIVRGMAKYLQMECPDLREATGDTDTNIQQKLTATLQLLEHNDFVLTHFNGTDEAAHRKNPREKAEFITKIDKEFLQALLTTYKKPLKIFVSGDHGTSSITGKHTDAPVPYIAFSAQDSKCAPFKDYRDILTFMYDGRE